jgi:hypothetical protein
MDVDGDAAARITPTRHITAKTVNRRQILAADMVIHRQMKALDFT